MSSHQLASPSSAALIRQCIIDNFDIFKDTLGSLLQNMFSDEEVPHQFYTLGKSNYEQDLHYSISLYQRLAKVESKQAY